MPKTYKQLTDEYRKAFIDLDDIFYDKSEVDEIKRVDDELLSCVRLEHQQILSQFEKDIISICVVGGYERDSVFVLAIKERFSKFSQSKYNFELINNSAKHIKEFNFQSNDIQERQEPSMRGNAECPTCKGYGLVSETYVSAYNSINKAISEAFSELDSQSNPKVSSSLKEIGIDKCSNPGSVTTLSGNDTLRCQDCGAVEGSCNCDKNY